MQWYDALLGKPWEAVADPPNSFTCGELCRWILTQRLGLEVRPILVDHTCFRECIHNMRDLASYNLFPFGGELWPFDVGTMSRSGKYIDHMGVLVFVKNEVKVLHCHQGIGVSLDSPAQLLASGFRRITWHRHKDMTKELALSFS
jgi:hypothetical protein